MRTAIAVALTLASTAPEPPRLTSPYVPLGISDGSTSCSLTPCILVPLYSLITQTYAGRVDIRKGLTETECEHDRLKALNQPADDDEREAAKRLKDSGVKPASDGWAPPPEYMIMSSDIYRAICEKQP